MADDRMKNDDRQQNMANKGEGQNWSPGQQSPGRQGDKQSGQHAGGQQSGGGQGGGQKHDMQDDEELDTGRAGSQGGRQNR